MPIDYALKILNGEGKPNLCNRYGNLTQAFIDRVGKSLKSFKDIANNIDKQLGNFTAIGRHKHKSFEEDVNVMVEELKK